MLRQLTRWAAVLLCAAIVAGATCYPSLTGGTGKLKVLITDKPFPYEFITNASIKITEVQVRPASAASQPADDDTDETAFITIFEDAAGKEFNLLDLRNGKADLLADADLPAGTYTQMRLIVTEGGVTLTDGRTFPLKVPSGEQTGIKLHFTFTIEAGGETTLLLDVDLSRAFSAIPSGRIDDVTTIREFKFHPSLAMRLIQILEAGSISGTVTDGTNPLAGVAVTALKDGEEITTTSTAADGTYQLAGLATGTYTVTFSLAGYTDVSVADVAVTAGAATENVDAALTAEAPPAP